MLRLPISLVLVCMVVGGPIAAGPVARCPDVSEPYDGGADHFRKSSNASRQQADQAAGRRQVFTAYRLTAGQRREAATVQDFVSLFDYTLQATLMSASLGLGAVTSSNTESTSSSDATRAEPAPALADRLRERQRQLGDAHPLQAPVEIAREGYAQVRRNVADFKCILHKRERIDGRLKSPQFLYVKFRLAQRRNGEVIAPLSVYAHYLAPRAVRGRKLLFVAGRNDDQILVRKGGRRMSYVKLTISPYSEAARRQGRYPIMQMGLDRMLRRLIERAESDMTVDPEGRNTRVTVYRKATVARRVCTRLKIEHPVRQPGLHFHLANLYVDDELEVPIRVEGYGWPASQDADPPLLEEYTYMKLELNPGLTDADFDPRVLDAR